MVLEFIARSIWFILPAYFANSSAVLIGGGKPIDCGKKWKDGRRIFGDGKTIRGFLGGLAVSVITAFLQNLVIPTSILLGFMLGLGAMAGDLLGSCYKRRRGIKRGEKFFPIDQLDFIAGSLVFSLPFYALSLETAVFLLILTPFIHLFMNWMAFKLKWKSVPW